MCDISQWQVEKLQWLSVWWSLGGIIGGAFLACTLQCKERKEKFWHPDNHPGVFSLPLFSRSGEENEMNYRLSSRHLNEEKRRLPMKAKQKDLVSTSICMWCPPTQGEAEIPLHLAAASEDKCLDNEWVSPFLSLNFIVEHYTVQYGMSLWSAGVSCPGWIPSQPLAYSQPPGPWGCWRDSLGAVWMILSSKTTCGCVTSTLLDTSAEYSTMRSFSSKPGSPTTARKVIFPWRDKRIEELSLQRQKI